MESVSEQLETIRQNFITRAGLFAVAKARDDRDGGFNAEFKLARTNAVTHVDESLDAYLAIRNDWIKK